MLGYLISPIAQIQDIDGKPISGAQLFVYLADTTTAAPTFSDFEGHRNTFPVVADLLGNCTIIADSANTYDLEIRNPDGTLLMGKKNLSVSFAGEDGRQTFSPGFGIGFSTVGNTTEINVDTDLIATQEDLNEKQDRLTPGANISIDDNRISVTGRKEVLAQYPIRVKRGTNNVKFYLDQAFIDEISSASVAAGVDLMIVDDPELGKVISVDTDGTVEGNKNFIAGQGTSIHGNYNIVSGIDNSSNGDSNDISGARNKVTSGNRNRVSGYHNSVQGYSNDVSGGDNTVNASSSVCSGLSNIVEGTGNVVGGYANRVTGNHSLAVGQGISLEEDHNAAVGKWNETGVDALFAVGMGTDDAHRADAFRVMKDGKIFVTNDGNMEQLKPGVHNYDVTPVDTTVTTVSTNTPIIDLGVAGVLGYYFDNQAQFRICYWHENDTPVSFNIFYNEGGYGFGNLAANTPQSLPTSFMNSNGLHNTVRWEVNGVFHVVDIYVDLYDNKVYTVKQV